MLFSPFPSNLFSFPLLCLLLACFFFSQYLEVVGYNLVLDESFSALLPRFWAGVGLGGLVITPSESALCAVFASLPLPFFGVRGFCFGAAVTLCWGRLDVEDR